MDELTTRQQGILKVIVSEYISSARPVGSDTVVDKYDVRVSPATVRNVMGVLEATGYIFHPHTSAGRVPSDRGYRFFVEHLMGEAELPPADRLAITNRLHQSDAPLEEMVRVAASSLAQATANAALATMPLASEVRLRHLDILPIRSNLVMLIVIFQEGVVRKQLVETDDAPDEVTDEAALRLLANRLDEKLRGQNATEIAAQTFTGQTVKFEERIRDAIVSLMRALDEQGLRNIWYDGITQLLNQPEFGSVERLRELIELLDRPESLAGVVGDAHAQAGINLVIGEENASQSLRGYTLVLTRYSVPGEASGVIGVIGPTRMRYDRAITSLRFVSDALSHLWREDRE